MAHYIAEKMAAIGSARGKAKASAQRECFEAILTLWDQLKLVPELDEKDTTQDQNEKRKNELFEHIDRLEEFESLSGEIKSILKAELGKF
ncbi:MAG: hypothetical protein L3J84_08085 [Gammaproteobacteria bacterium]|nr:hypothetical protein [Gammaproteobacteria bacterium]